VKPKLIHNENDLNPVVEISINKLERQITTQEQIFIQSTHQITLKQLNQT
jgi:hypothetical protein